MSIAKVLYITAAGASANSFLKDHFRILSEHGIVVALACSDDKDSETVVTETGVQHFPLELPTKISPWKDFLSLLRLINIIRLYKPQIIHAHMSKAGLIGSLAGWVCRTPIRLYHNHGMAYFSSRGKRKQLLGLVERIACFCATEVVFCSQSTLKKAIGLGLCPHAKATIIGAGTISGVDTDTFSYVTDKTRLRSVRMKFNIPEQKQIVGFVGRIVAHKGIDTLLEAWERLPQATSKNSVLLICGKHEEDALYQRLCRAMEQCGNIVYVGRQNDIASIYPIMDVLVLPSWHEGFPYSVLEALSCGIPAIVSNVAGNVDAVVHKKTGLIVDVHDASNLAATIDYLLKNPTIRNQYGIAGREFVLKNYDRSHVLDNLLYKYRALLDIHK